MTETINLFNKLGTIDMEDLDISAYLKGAGENG